LGIQIPRGVVRPTFDTYLENAHRNPCGASGIASAAFAAWRSGVELIRELLEHTELTEYSQRIEKRPGACNNNANGTRYKTRGTRDVSANVAYPCGCQFSYCIPCEQRLPKFRTIFLRMFGTIARSIVCKTVLAEDDLEYQMSHGSSDLCEVRVPTFRRPKLLRRGTSIDPRKNL
jgi:hypothetical protein